MLPPNYVITAVLPNFLNSWNMHTLFFKILASCFCETTLHEINSASAMEMEIIT